MNDTPETREPIRARLAHELRLYLVISLYLFLCFSVVLVYAASVSPDQTLPLIVFGTALAKALVLGKFIMIGEALKVGSRLKAPTLAHRIAWRTAGMVFVLMVLKVAEELVVGLVHGQGVGEIVEELGQRSPLSLFGPVLLMLLIIIPLLAVIELDRALGEGGLRKLLRGQDPR